MNVDCTAKRDKVMVDFDLGFRYADESAAALKDVRGALSQGTCVVLCGNSGCGKSTLLRCSQEGVGVEIGELRNRASSIWSLHRRLRLGCHRRYSRGCRRACTSTPDTVH